MEDGQGVVHGGGGDEQVDGPHRSQLTGARPRGLQLGGGHADLCCQRRLAVGRSALSTPGRSGWPAPQRMRGVFASPATKRSPTDGSAGLAGRFAAHGIGVRDGDDAEPVDPFVVLRVAGEDLEPVGEDAAPVQSDLRARQPA